MSNRIAAMLLTLIEDAHAAIGKRDIKKVAFLLNMMKMIIQGSRKGGKSAALRVC